MTCSPLLSAMRYPCRYVLIVSRISTTIGAPIAQMHSRIRCLTHMLSRKRRIPYGRDFPSNFPSLGSLPPRSCFVPATRALTPLWQTLSYLANQPYSRRLLCSSGLGFRIIAGPRGLSPQCAYRVDRTKKGGCHKGIRLLLR